MSRGVGADDLQRAARAARLARSLTPRERRAALAWLAREHPPVFAELERLIAAGREPPRGGSVESGPEGTIVTGRAQARSTAP